MGEEDTNLASSPEHKGRSQHHPQIFNNMALMKSMMATYIIESTQLPWENILWDGEMITIFCDMRSNRFFNSLPIKSPKRLRLFLRALLLVLERGHPAGQTWPSTVPMSKCKGTGGTVRGGEARADRKEHVAQSGGRAPPGPGERPGERRWGRGRTSRGRVPAALGVPAPAPAQAPPQAVERSEAEGRRGRIGCRRRSWGPLPRWPAVLCHLLSCHLILASSLSCCGSPLPSSSATPRPVLSSALVPRTCAKATADGDAHSSKPHPHPCKDSANPVQRETATNKTER